MERLSWPGKSLVRRSLCCDRHNDIFKSVTLTLDKLDRSDRRGNFYRLHFVPTLKPTVRFH